MRLGPITGATLIVRNLERSLVAYVDQLGMAQVDSDVLPLQRALDMGDATLQNARVARLRACSDVDPWLSLIEMPQAPLSLPLARRGWLALVLTVTGIDALAALIDRGIGQRLGQPAASLPGHATRSLQWVGPDGEVLRLIPRQPPTADCSESATARVDRLFGVVLGAADCNTALGFYEGLGLFDRWRLPVHVHTFDHDPVETPIPAAFGKLGGAEIIEIDQLAGLQANDSSLRTGLRLVSFARSNRTGQRLAAQHDPSARILAGPEGEGIELV